jgi:hypothetical protein
MTDHSDPSDTLGRCFPERFRHPPTFGRSWPIGWGTGLTVYVTVLRILLDWLTMSELRDDLAALKIERNIGHRG